MRPSRAVFAALAAALAIAVSGCGDDENGSSDGSADAMSAPPASKSGSGKITIEDFLYEPAEVTVSAGKSVSFSNRDSANHTATAEDGSFDTGTLGEGDSAAIELTKPGTYAYVCSFHPFMKGQVTVGG